MTGKANKINQLKQIIKVDNFDKVSKEDFEYIQQLVEKGKLSKDDIQLLIDIIPNFIDLQKDYIDGLKTLINSVKDTQKEALHVIMHTIDGLPNILQNLIEKSETEELRSKIADISLKLADINLEITKKIAEMNEDNNNAWKSIAKMASVVVGVVGITSAIIVTKNKV